MIPQSFETEKTYKKRPFKQAESKADLFMATSDGGLLDVEGLQSMGALSKLTFESAAIQMGKSYQRADEVLATKISIAVIMSYPLLPAGRMQHALFTKRMFMEGEYNFVQYVEKMRNLFPNRMESLPRSLQESMHTMMVATG